MASISQNTLGVDLAAVYTPQDFQVQPFKSGEQVLGDDGSRYQYAVAAEAITGDTATCTIALNGTTGEYEATATLGGSTSPADDMATGDYAFFALLNAVP